MKRISVGLVVVFLGMTTLLQGREDIKETCLELSVSEVELSESIDCYKRKYDSIVKKDKTFLDFLNLLKVEKKIIRESEVLLEDKPNRKVKEKLLDLLLRLDLSDRRFFNALEMERKVVKELYASGNKKQPKYLQSYYLQELFPSIERKIDTFFDEIEHISTENELDTVEKKYRTCLEQSKQKVEDDNDITLEIYKKRAKQAKVLDDLSKDTLSDVMLSLYLEDKDGNIKLIKIKKYYIELREKKDMLVKRLSMQ